MVLETGVAIPLDIFPDNAVGQESCLAVIVEAQAAIKQATGVTCGRFELTPMSAWEPA